MLQIPLVKSLYHSVETTINDNNFKFETTYNKRTEKYAMNVYISNELVIGGIQLVGGVDIADYTSLPLDRVYCINKLDTEKDFSYDGLGTDGMVVIIEDSDLEG